MNNISLNLNCCSNHNDNVSSGESCTWSVGENVASSVEGFRALENASGILSENKLRPFSNSNYRRPLSDLKARISIVTKRNKPCFSAEFSQNDNSFVINDAIHQKDSHLPSPNSLTDLCQLSTDLSCCDYDEEELVEVSRKRNLSTRHLSCYDYDEEELVEVSRKRNLSIGRRVMLAPRSKHRVRSNEGKPLPLFPIF